MAERRDNLLKIIVEEYIKSANPIGSSLIVNKYFKDVSSATIRNDMARLEEEGLIYASIAQMYIDSGLKSHYEKVGEYCEKALEHPQEVLTALRLYSFWGEALTVKYENKQKSKEDNKQR